MTLEARSIEMRIGDTRILNSVDLTGPPGSVTAIIGPNGAGKSTLLKVLAGLVTPTAGTVRVDGSDIRDLSFRELAKRRSFMSASLPYGIDFTVREVVAMGRHPWNSTRSENDDAVDRSIQTLALGDLADAPYSTLSTGEARRVQVARLLTQKAPVVLADEPVAGLDIGHSEMVLRALADAAREGRTVVCVLHDLNAAATHAGHLVLIADGGVVTEGTREDVLTESSLTKVYGHPVTVVDHPTRPGPAILTGESEPHLRA